MAFGNLVARTILDHLTGLELRSQVCLLTGPAHVGKATHLLESLAAAAGSPELFLSDGTAQNMREALRLCQSHAILGSYRALVLDGLDIMSDATVSACLKVCEEPPAETRIFILVEDSGLLPDSLLSRIQEIVRFKALSEHEILEFAQGFGNVDSTAAHLCRGRPGLYRAMTGGGYDQLWNAVSSHISGASNALFSDIPSVITELKNGPSADRTAVSITCLDAVEKSILSSGFSSRVIRFLQFSSNVVKYHGADVQSYWTRALLLDPV